MYHADVDFSQQQLERSKCVGCKKTKNKAEASSILAVMNVSAFLIIHIKLTLYFKQLFYPLLFPAVLALLSFIDIFYRLLCQKLLTIQLKGKGHMHPLPPALGVKPIIQSCLNVNYNLEPLQRPVKIGSCKEEGRTHSAQQQRLHVITAPR